MDILATSLAVPFTNLLALPISGTFNGALCAYFRVSQGLTLKAKMGYFPMESYTMESIHYLPHGVLDHTPGNSPFSLLTKFAGFIPIV